MSNRSSAGIIPPNLCLVNLPICAHNAAGRLSERIQCFHLGRHPLVPVRVLLPYPPYRQPKPVASIQL